MKITSLSFHKVNIPFGAPMLWSGGVNRSWTRIVVRMQTDEGIEGIAETCGGDATLVQLHAIKDYFLGEDPFDRERILKNFWYLPTYQGNSGKYAIQALETACYDVMGKATGRPLCQLLGGRFRAEIPMIAYMFYRLPGPDGRGGEQTTEAMLEATHAIVERTGAKTISRAVSSLPTRSSPAQQRCAASSRTESSGSTRTVSGRSRRRSATAGDSRSSASSGTRTLAGESRA